jgi:pyruvate dehydrogenase E1 component alpha subunit
MQRDPVNIARATLINWGVLDAGQADMLETEARAEVDAAFVWAKEQPLCKPEDGLMHVYAEGRTIARQFG